MNNKLEIDSVILKFGTETVLQDIYLKIETGKITGLLGRNGSGKTCLMNIIYGNLKAQEKTLRLDNKYISSKYLPISSLTYLPQFSFIPKHLTIERIFKDYKADFNDFIVYFPEFKKYYKTKFTTLSGGEQRIIEVYLILVSKTKFCMLDEPFSQIMPLHIESIKKLILREKEKKGLLITDHLYEHIIDLCDDIYIIKNRKIHLTESIEDIHQLGYIFKKNME